MGVLEQDPWQYHQLLRSSGNNLYQEVKTSYLLKRRDMELAEDTGILSLSYKQYVDEYVKSFSELIPVRPGIRAFDSAVGNGWLIRGLLDVKAAEGWMQSEESSRS